MKKKYYGAFDKRLVFVLFCGIAFSFPYCFRPFWWDESITLIDFVQLPFSEIYKQYAIANNHIGYTILLKVWDILSGNLFIESELHYRIFSLFIGLTTLVILFYLIKKIYSSNSAFFITLIFAVSQPFAIYSTALRGYILSLLFLSLALFSIFCIFEKKSYSHYVVYFFSAFAAIAVMPTNIIGLYAGVFGIIPFIAKFLREKKVFWQILLCKNYIFVSVVPLVVFLIFYLPLFNKLLFIAKHNSGTVSISSSLLNIYLGFILSFFQIFILFIIVVFFPRKTHNNSKKLNIDHEKTFLLFPLDLKSLILFGVLFICLPLFMMQISKAPPFPRLFFQFWPLAMIYCAGLFEGIWKTVIMLLFRERKRNNFQELKHKIYLKIYFIMVFLVLFWGGLMLNFNYILSDKIFENGLYDDYLAPYFIRNFHPRKMILDVKELSKQRRIPIYVSESTDFASIVLYSNLFNVKDLFQYIKLPMSQKRIQLPNNKDFYYIATFNEDVRTFAEIHKLSNPILIKKYGFQNLYLFQK